MIVVGIKGDADIYTIDNAIEIYGEEAISGILNDDGNTYLDEEGNELWPVLSTDEESEQL